MTPAEWMGLLGGGVGFLAGVGALVKLGADLRAPSPAPSAQRDAVPPPAPVAPPVAVLESRLESAERRIAGLEDRERAEAAEAATYRGEVKASIARLLERSRSLGQREERASE